MHIKILENTKPDYQWVKIEKRFFNLKQDLYICVIYNPPENSSYSKNLDYDILECVEKDVIHYKDIGDIILCGDFNARISSEPDHINNDECNFLPLFPSYSADKQLLERQSMDSKLDKRGKELIDFCISNQLRILNGRTFGDLMGNFTCFTPNGCSTVDYTIVSENVLDQILFFKVSEFMSTLSDCHCYLEWFISAEFSIHNVLDESCIEPLLPNYIWSDESPAKFETAMRSDEIKQRLEKLSNCNLDGSAASINGAATEITDILISAAEKSLKKPNIGKKKKATKLEAQVSLYCSPDINKSS